MKDLGVRVGEMVAEDKRVYRVSQESGRVKREVQGQTPKEHPHSSREPRKRSQRRGAIRAERDRRNLEDDVEETF